MYIVNWHDDEDGDNVAKFETLKDAETWIKSKCTLERYEPTGFDYELPVKEKECLLPKKKLLPERESEKTKMTLLFPHAGEDTELDMFLHAATDHISGLHYEIIGDAGHGNV